jgi:hypothetical protein
MATTQSPQGRDRVAPQAPQTLVTQRDYARIARRELLISGLALFCGFVLIPLAIWLVGNRILGPYTHGQDPSNGGPMRLLGDFFTGLGHGSVIFWCVGIGPYVILSLARLLFAFLRSAPAASTQRH